MHPKNLTKYKMLDKIAKHPACEEIWDEEDDGLWVNLNQGWHWDHCTSVHKHNVKDLIESFKDIRWNPEVNPLITDEPETKEHKRARLKANKVWKVNIDYKKEI